MQGEEATAARPPRSAAGQHRPGVLARPAEGPGPGGGDGEAPAGSVEAVEENDGGAREMAPTPPLGEARPAARRTPGDALPH
jgi:hypothetical protein